MLSKYHIRKSALLRNVLLISMLLLFFYACNDESMQEQTSNDVVVLDSSDALSNIVGQLIDTTITFDPVTFVETMTIVKTDIYKDADVMPLFPGCDDALKGDSLTQCALKKLLSFMDSQIKYPEEAKNNAIEGMVAIEFIVASDGSVVQPKIVRGLGYGCDEEVMRIINTMPNWIPGEHDGKKVAVQMVLPFSFKLG